MVEDSIQTLTEDMKSTKVYMTRKMDNMTEEKVQKIHDESSSIDGQTISNKRMGSSPVAREKGLEGEEVKHSQTSPEKGAVFLLTSCSATSTSKHQNKRSYGTLLHLLGNHCP
jgi:hypothetical protein